MAWGIRVRDAPLRLLAKVVRLVSDQSKGIDVSVVRTIGAYEAKTHLPRLLDEVARGQSITITKHGVPVAMLVPPDTNLRVDVARTIEEIRDLRRNIGPLAGESVHEMIADGRRF